MGIDEPRPSNEDLTGLKQAWHSHAAATRITYEAEQVAHEVRNSAERFRQQIFWRDVREVGVALLLVPIWIVLGALIAAPWTWLLTVPALIWVAGFLAVDRWRYPHVPNDPGAPLLDVANASLRQVERQIWLLRNVFWWYLLPLLASGMTFLLHVSWRTSDAWLEFLLVGGVLGLLQIAICAGTYWVNQRAVQKHLEPQRQRWSTLAASLGGDDEVADLTDVSSHVAALADPAGRRREGS
jgi:hypothetical protein